MRADTKEHVERQYQLIRSQLQKRPRQVEPGCLVKVALSDIIGPTNVQGGCLYIYGIVGTQRDICQLSDAKAYDVLFSLDGVQISRSLLPIFTIPVYENEMVILRFPDQNASLDDPNIDEYFHRVDGRWKSRSSNNINY